MQFEEAVEFILKWEGGETVDTGGYTKYGISQKAYPELDIKNLTIEQAKEIYRRDYWDRCRCGEMVDGLDVVVFDTAVNTGVERAGKFLQMALNRVLGEELVVDGVIGEKTIGAVKKLSSVDRVFDCIEWFLLYRLEFYKRLGSWYDIYKKGWTRRVLNLFRFALGYVFSREERS